MKSEGFTLPELIIVSVLTAVFSTMLFQFTISTWQMGYKIQADSDAFLDRLNASDYLRDSLGTSSGLIDQNSLADANVPASLQDTTGAGAQYWTPIHPLPGIHGTTTGLTPLLYFRRLSTDASKNVISNSSTPYEDEYVIYHDGPQQQLKVRVLANPNAPGNAARTTCPATVASSSCPADKVLAHNIDTVDLTYYSRAGVLINYAPSPPTYDSSGSLINGADFPAVEVVQLNLHLSKKATFNDAASTQSSTVIRIALRNS